ncbi:DsbA family oxidoreductase [Adhaeribacter aquaticus]|uniref:DsbA family oxidoreductase n=1 Tax=Adhaeribacter aquaticus TaxID=299567 RepID=UPI0004180BEC|nr:DsbA family oxidoreductase [Adhaeribacter aquaticus]
MLNIRVYSDYVCPYCFLGEQVLLRAIKGMENQIAIEWMPFELRPFPTPTLLPEGEYLQQTWQNSVYPMAAQLNIPIILPKVSPQPYTHLAFEGYQFAKKQNLGTAYNHRMFTAFFQEEQDIGQVDVLVNLATEVGLNASDFRKNLENRTYKDQHQEALRHAYEEIRISAVPTFVINDVVYRGLLREQDIVRIVTEALNSGGF